jgi:hypothetical protein
MREDLVALEAPSEERRVAVEPAVVVRAELPGRAIVERDDRDVDAVVARRVLAPRAE